MILLDNSGFNEILNKISELKKKLAEIRKEKGNAYQDDSNTWHDNYAYEFANYRELDILDQIEELYKTYESAILVERGHDCNVCDIGDQFNIRFFNDVGYEDELYTLVAKNLNIGSAEISINSPIGNAVYLKEYGSEINFISNGNKVHIKIFK